MFQALILPSFTKLMVFASATEHIANGDFTKGFLCIYYTALVRYVSSNQNWRFMPLGKTQRYSIHPSHNDWHGQLHHLHPLRLEAYRVAQSNESVSMTDILSYAVTRLHLSSRARSLAIWLTGWQPRRKAMNLRGFTTVPGKTSMSNRANERKTRVVGSWLGMFKFVWKPSQPIGDHPLTDTLFLQIAFGSTNLHLAMSFVIFLSATHTIIHCLWIYM